MKKVFGLLFSAALVQAGCSDYNNFNDCQTWQECLRSDLSFSMNNTSSGARLYAVNKTDQPMKIGYQMLCNSFVTGGSLVLDAREDTYKTFKYSYCKIISVYKK